jgi:hypothetical protein
MRGRCVSGGLRAAHLWLLIVALTCPATRAAQGAENAGRCFDAVIIARLLSQDPTPFPQLEANEIVMRWPWVLAFEPEKVLYAGVPVPTHRIEVGTIQHTSFRPGIPYFLLFLSRAKRGFRAQWIDLYLTRDAKGRFVRPFVNGVDDLDTFPRFWIPPDYLARQVSVRFRTRGAWWLRDDYDDDGNPIPLSSKPKWMEENGLRLDDLRSVIKQQAIQPCEGSPFRAG